MRRALLLLCLLAACRSSDDTVLDLEILSPEGARVTDLDVTIYDRTRSVPMQDHVKLVVPDAWAGAEVAVEVAGRRGQVVLLEGTASVTPRLGLVTPVSITMVPVPCDDTCALGDTACAAGGVVHCEVREIDGCLAWSAAVPCPSETPACSSGECAVTCSDECQAGSVTCASATATAACGQSDGDACTDWLPPEACPAGSVCAGGRCVETCSDACTAGARECAGDEATRSCGQTDGDSCTEWQAPVACNPGQHCEDGQCQADCSDACTAGASECAGDGATRTCGNSDADACTEWLPPEACDPGQHCSGGHCQPDCTNECQPGTHACVGSGSVRTCGQTDADSCSEWQPPQACPAGDQCVAGACVCMNECAGGETRCHGNRVQRCGDWDGDGCSEWSGDMDCGDGMRCHRDVCEAH